MIESYAFGKMGIDGQVYTQDLMILPSGEVVSSWWRKAGHELLASDIGVLIEARLDFLVIGTGCIGLMKPDPGLCSALEAGGTTAVVLPTQQAAGEYNSLRGQGKHVGACFHLTC
jgi:hypothetical protein